ncbi:MAG TPA: hypothetical protein VMB71_15785, partial [Acetobacteraceae bacterium]|nr:hypothetical protein [Acetobacteraceae bacterium]
SVASGRRPNHGKPVLPTTDRSFLVLFFKKELFFLITPPRTRHFPPTAANPACSPSRKSLKMLSPAAGTLRAQPGRHILNGDTSMSVGAASSTAFQPSSVAAGGSTAKSPAAAKGHHHRHPADSGAATSQSVTAGTLTSSGTTPVLDTLV